MSAGKRKEKIDSAWSSWKRMDKYGSGWSEVRGGRSKVQDA